MASRALLIGLLVSAIGICLFINVVSAEPRRGRGRGRTAKIVRENSKSAADSDGTSNRLIRKEILKEGVYEGYNVTKAKNNRTGKIFSLFSVIQFPNAPCKSTSTGGAAAQRNGTCYTTQECANKGGLAQGSCAAGFGTCCLFTVSTSGTTVSENCTYIQNPGFPGTLSTTTSVSYTITKCSSLVCYLRLDFDTFSLVGTGLTTEISGGLCLDMFTVTTSPTGKTIPTICGLNTGQHIFVDVGNTANGMATLNFAFDGNTNFARNWEIKVTQVECSNKASPPNCCLQYHTGQTGRISTFNFIPALGTDNHLANQDYSICIRQECGFCCIEYLPCSDPGSFTLDAAIAIAAALTDTSCTSDHIGISDAAVTCSMSNSPIPFDYGRFCGKLFGPAGISTNVKICDCTPPFMVDVFTDTLSDAGAAITANALNMESRGVCLDYNQVPC